MSDHDKHPRQDAAVPARPGASRPALIETVRVDARNGIPLLDGHLARLTASAHALGYPLQVDAARAQLTALARDHAPATERRVRLLLAADGALTLDCQPLAPLDPLPAAACWTAEPLDAADPLLHHKTTARERYAQASDWLAAHPTYFDVVFLNRQGHLCEGTRTNIYLRRDGQWFTPPLASGVLPGVQRAALLAAGQVRARTLTRADLQAADGWRLSNALRGWFDVQWQPDV